MIGSINGGNGMMPMGRPQMRGQALTDEQKQTITDILSNYDAESITQEDAQSIFESFREAGIRPGEGMRETIEAAGFDAENLRELGRPPGPPPGGMMQSGGMGGFGEVSSFFKLGDSQGVDVNNLQTLQTILNQYDLSSMSTDDEDSLMSKLQQSGLLFPGSTVDIRS